MCCAEMYYWVYLPLRKGLWCLYKLSFQFIQSSCLTALVDLDHGGHFKSPLSKNASYLILRFPTVLLDAMMFLIRMNSPWKWTQWPPAIPWCWRSSVCVNLSLALTSLVLCHTPDQVTASSLQKPGTIVWWRCKRYISSPPASQGVFCHRHALIVLTFRRDRRITSGY